MRHRDPEFFRGMNTIEIYAQLVVDERENRHTVARALGARCVNCCDTGMNGGQFCSCEVGSKLAMQAHRK